MGVGMNPDIKIIDTGNKQEKGKRTMNNKGWSLWIVAMICSITITLTNNNTVFCIGMITAILCFIGITKWGIGEERNR